MGLKSCPTGPQRSGRGHHELRWARRATGALVSMALLTATCGACNPTPAGGAELCGAYAKLMTANGLAQQITSQAIQIGSSTGNAQTSAAFRSLVATDAPAIVDATAGLDSSLANATFAADPAFLVDLRGAAPLLAQVGTTFQMWVNSGYPADPTGFSQTWTAAVQANQYLGKAKDELSTLDAAGVLHCGQ
jgi:hypothetical protein